METPASSLNNISEPKVDFHIWQGLSNTVYIYSEQQMTSSLEDHTLACI